MPFYILIKFSSHALLTYHIWIGKDDTCLSFSCKESRIFSQVFYKDQCVVTVIKNEVMFLSILAEIILLKHSLFYKKHLNEDTCKIIYAFYKDFVIILIRQFYSEIQMKILYSIF